ncbi:hypothetical protein ED312_11545 [Sinomicrobium pectinilyticum]|uniref:Uncharacterized protein n=1 Tax=Sinomicrobium pectinilyticum TaxID=1084421 RepID=A0A3N0EER3_SINP1|nr:hypothetical protein [Sinomicrobium pectinilyticum]RNL86267.1 hypothetical protein ED312_11545 [Sinomicrobium pectinilyticum]
MKKFTLLFLAVLIGLAGCEKEDADFITSDYYSLKGSSYPPDSGTDEYISLFNGDTIGTAIPFTTFLAAGEGGILELVKKGETTPEFSQEITLSENMELEFIKLPGDPVMLYEADQYTTFSFNLSYYSIEERQNYMDYQFLFNGNSIMLSSNIIRLDNLKGTLEFRKKGETVFKEEVTVTPEETLNYLQLSEREYLRILSGDEEAPAPGACKIRFFYFADDFPGVEELEITLYYVWRNYDTEELASFTLQPGVMTDYTGEVDWAQRSADGQRLRGLSFDLKNPATGEILAEKIHCQVGRGSEGLYTVKIIDDSSWNFNVIVIRD